MTFNELLTEVYALTNRPDLVTETTSAIKAATLKAHGSDFFSKDLYETGIEWDTEDYMQSMDYISLVSNFRALKYLRRVESATDEMGTFFTILTPEETLDSYGNNKTDIAYVAGRILQIRSSVKFSKALYGCYVFPIVRPEAYSSWIAEMFPYAIIFEAARVLFKTIGFDEQSAQYNSLVAEQYAELKMSALSDVGY